MSVIAAVPVKDLVNAKQRLVPALSPAERRELARAMLGDVLEALVAALPGSVVVITSCTGHPNAPGSDGNWKPPCATSVPSESLG